MPGRLLPPVLGFADDTLDKLLDEGRTTLDQNKRKAVYRQVGATPDRAWRRGCFSTWRPMAKRPARTSTASGVCRGALGLQEHRRSQVRVEGVAPMAKVELSRMTWREAQDAFRRNPVILLPMGSVEQSRPARPRRRLPVRHGGGSTDRGADRARSSPRRSPWGYSEHFRPFPGTLSVRPETLTLLLEDICDGFLAVSGSTTSPLRLRAQGQTCRILEQVGAADAGDPPAAGGDR